MTNELSIMRPMKYWWLYFTISLSVIVPGTYSLIRFGLKPSIDFTGGSTMVWSGPSLSKSAIEESAKKLGINVVALTVSGSNWTVTTSPLDSATHAKFVPSGVQELSYDTVGPSLGGELITKTIYGLALAATLILLYVAYRFQNFKFGASAILAMLHDLLVVLGVFSLLGHFYGVQVDTLFVTALLTILSFSVHDTIVVYDRIRELKKKHGYLEFEDIVNRAVVETMGRSLNNSLTIIFMLLAMYLLGGTTTKWFILALLVGTTSGTYSSTFTAAPILMFWDKLARRRRKRG